MLEQHLQASYRVVMYLLVSLRLRLTFFNIYLKIKIDGRFIRTGTELIYGYRAVCTQNGFTSALHQLI